ncbi:MAG: hypothetical protein PWQ20_1433 [Thermotogaceae bacterium]|nr:hypothetical protein [Thermotogaceae bacterium]
MTIKSVLSNKRIDFSDAIVFNYQHPVNRLKK